MNKPIQKVETKDNKKSLIILSCLSTAFISMLILDIMYFEPKIKKIEEYEKTSYKKYEYSQEFERNGYVFNIDLEKNFKNEDIDGDKSNIQEKLSPNIEKVLVDYISKNKTLSEYNDVDFYKLKVNIENNLNLTEVDDHHKRIIVKDIQILDKINNETKTSINYDDVLNDNNKE